MTRRPSHRIVIVAAVVAVVTTLSIKTAAFTTSGYVWANGLMAYFINPTNLDVSSQAAIAAVRAGADAWPQQANIRFTFAYSGQSSQTTTTNDGINLVLFRNA